MHKVEGVSESRSKLMVTTLAFVVLSTAIFFIVNISLGMFSALLPLFVVLYMFGKIGKGMFQSWLKVMISLIFTTLFGAIVMGVCFELITVIPGMSFIGELLKGLVPDMRVSPSEARGAGEAAAYAFVATLWLCIYFLKQVPTYASQIGGVVTASTFELGHAMGHAGLIRETGMGKAPGGREETQKRRAKSHNVRNPRKVDAHTFP